MAAPQGPTSPTLPASFARQPPVNGWQSSFLASFFTPRFSDFSMILFIVFYRIWILRCAENVGPAMFFFMFFMFRKCLHFSWFVASQNRLWTSKNHTFLTLHFDTGPVFVGAVVFSRMQIRSAGPTLFRGTAMSQFQPGIVTIDFFVLFFVLRFLTLKNSFFSFLMVLDRKSVV